MAGRSVVLIVDDEPAVAEVHGRLLGELGYSFVIETDPRRVERRLLDNADIAIVLLDIRMPDMNGLEVLQKIKLIRPSTGVVMATVINDIDMAVNAIKCGAYNYILKPVDVERLGEVLRSFLDNHPVSYEEELCLPEFITCHEPFREIFRRLRAYAQQDVPVLIEGETGTGKEVTAQSIHSLSERLSAPFVPVNMAALSSELFASELFGHRKGSFTGAFADHRGYFESCANGTLFLDEIGDISLEGQKKLLRVLQEGRYTRVGDTESRVFQARLVLATNKNLQTEVEEGRFREDLYYRISSFRISLPPLRERAGDIELLARYFLEKYRIQFGRPVEEFSVEALQILRGYSFPGNVRELEGIVSGAVLIEMSPMIQPESLPKHVMTEPAPGDDLQSVKRQKVLSALNQCRGNQTQAARVLGVSRGTLNRWIRSFREDGYLT